MVGSPSDHDDSGDEEEEAAAEGDLLIDHDREDESAEECLKRLKLINLEVVIKHSQLVPLLATGRHSQDTTTNPIMPKNLKMDVDPSIHTK